MCANIFRQIGLYMAKHRGLINWRSFIFTGHHLVYATTSIPFGYSLAYTITHETVRVDGP